MISFHELRVPLYLETPKGDALCYFVVWLHQDHDLLWVCFIEATRECWTFRNPEVRLCWNHTMGLGRAEADKFPMKPQPSGPSAGDKSK